MLLVLQGTPYCNLDCSYCYLPDRDNKARLDLATIDQIVALLRNSSKLPRERVTVIWHAGEPLVLPVKFYRAACEAFGTLHAVGIHIAHSFQTNGTLITPDWAEFFRDINAIVGISIDGPQEFHDLHRRYRNGSGSWQKGMRGIRLLQRAQIPFHTITVLTRPALSAPEAFFDFFVANGISHIGFNIEEIESANRHSSIATPAGEELFGSFLRCILRRNAAEGFPLRIREAENASAVLLNGGLDVNPLARKGDILTIDTKGNVTTFSPELLGMQSARHHNFIIGNIWETTLDEMVSGEVAGLLADEISRGVERCRTSCDFFRFCRGGAPVNKLSETGSFDTTETMYCRLTVQTLLRECTEVIWEQRSSDISR